MDSITNILNILLITIGFISLGLGVLGIFLPLLPTTPLLLLSAACFSKGSDKFYTWLLNNRFLGRYIRNYMEGKGIPPRIKILAITMLWTTIVICVLFLLDILFVKIFLIMIAVIVTYHILRQKTLR